MRLTTGRAGPTYLGVCLLIIGWTLSSIASAAEKPNILVIWGDDVGVHNISAYNHGIMGYQTPNIDRIADEGALFTDAYALIKVLSTDFGLHRFRVLANQVQSAQEGRDLFSKISRVTDRYLDVTLSFMGAIPYDENLKKAVKSQKQVVTAFPRSKVAQAFKNLARKVEAWPLPQGANGQMQFFVERLVQYSSGYGEI